MKIAVDFDDVICKRDDFPRTSFMDCKPVEGAKFAISWILSQGHELYILTMNDPDTHTKIHEWLRIHHFPALRVTNIKESGTRIFLDDRAIRFTNWLDFTKYLG